MRAALLAAAFASALACAMLVACSASESVPTDGGAASIDPGPSPNDHAPHVDAAAPLPTRDAEALRDADATVEGDVAPFHVVGRVDRSDPAGPRFGWPGTEVRVRFAGTGLALELADTGVSHYDATIDGVPRAPVVVTGPPGTVPIAQGLSPGVHELVLIKRTETSLGVTQLLAVAPSAGSSVVPAPAPSGRRMEIVGDSITCGFGVLGADETCAFSADTEVEPLAWGALAAKELHALHTSIAVSGLGVLRNYDGATTDTMPDRYGRALADDPSSTWDHGFVPDVIVVNLGTNDFAGGKGDPGPAFQDAYAAFLATLRRIHPNARIVAATSPMLSEPHHASHRGYLERAVALRTAAGDTKASLLDIEEQSESDGLGCAYHPSRTTHRKMAAKLVAHVKPLMGW